MLGNQGPGRGGQRCSEELTAGMRQMAMTGSGCGAHHSFTGHCPREAPHGLGDSIRSPSCSEPSIAPPQKKLNLLPRPYDLACLRPQLHLPSTPHLCPSRPGILSFHTRSSHLRALSQLFLLPLSLLLQESQCLSPSGLHSSSIPNRGHHWSLWLEELPHHSVCPGLHMSSHHFGTR